MHGRVHANLRAGGALDVGLQARCLVGKHAHQHLLHLPLCTCSALLNRYISEETSFTRLREPYNLGDTGVGQSSLADARAACQANRPQETSRHISFQLS